MENKQTAVEWLVDKWGNAIHWNWEQIKQWFEQAKEMEKEQIIDAFDEGQNYEYEYHINSAPKFDSQTYFTETYGK